MPDVGVVVRDGLADGHEALDCARDGGADALHRRSPCRRFAACRHQATDLVDNEISFLITRTGKFVNEY